MLELPEHASPQLVQMLASDAADLYSAVQAEGTMDVAPLQPEQPEQPEPVGRRRRGSGRVRSWVDS